MKERLYAEEIAVIRGVTIQRARRILEEIERANARAVGRDGKRRFTTREHVMRLHDPVGEERLDKLSDAVDSVRQDAMCQSDLLESLGRQLAAIEVRLSSVERRSR